MGVSWRPARNREAVRVVGPVNTEDSGQSAHKHTHTGSYLRHRCRCDRCSVLAAHSHHANRFANARTHDWADYGAALAQECDSLHHSNVHDSNDDLCEALRTSNGSRDGLSPGCGGGGSRGSGADLSGCGYNVVAAGVGGVFGRSVTDTAWELPTRGGCGGGGGGSKCSDEGDFSSGDSNSYNNAVAAAAAATAAMLDYCSNLGADPTQSPYGHHHLNHHHHHHHQNPAANSAVSSLLNMNMNMNMNMNVSMNSAVSAAAATVEAASRQGVSGGQSGSPGVGGSSTGSGGSAFVLNSPPLAALHNLTEMKFPSSSSFMSQSDYQQTMKQMQLAMSAGSTPHGINDILSRPHGLLPRLGSGMYLGAPQIRFPKLAELPGRQPIYWPGVMTQPWRPPPGKDVDCTEWNPLVNH